MLNLMIGLACRKKAHMQKASLWRRRHYANFHEVRQRCVPDEMPVGYLYLYETCSELFQKFQVEIGVCAGRSALCVEV
jgi:hypothetical protein